MSSSPFSPDCTCGHQYVDHASSRARGLHAPQRGVCLHGGCGCREYEPVQPPLPGTEAEPPDGPAGAVTFGARRSQTPQGYRDLEHFDVAQDTRAELEAETGEPARLLKEPR